MFRGWLQSTVVLGVVFVALLPRSAAADARVSRLRLGLTPDAHESQQRFPPGTQRIFAVFDFEGAAGEVIGVAVDARGLPDLYRSSAKPYTGDGTDSEPISGTVITQALAGELAESARAAQRDAQLAATQSFGVQEYLLSAHMSLLRMGYAGDLLERAELGRDGAALLDRIGMVADEASQLVRRAVSLPMSELDGKRSLASEMAEPLAEAVTEAERLSEAAGRLTDLPIPETGPDSRAAYAVQLQVGGNPAIVAEFLIARSRPIYLPWVFSACQPIIPAIRPPLHPAGLLAAPRE